MGNPHFQKNPARNARAAGSEFGRQKNGLGTDSMPGTSLTPIFICLPFLALSKEKINISKIPYSTSPLRGLIPNPTFSQLIPLQSQAEKTMHAHLGFFFK